MPSLDGATGWLNSEPLGPAEMRGHVVLVKFWALTCINWLRQEPYVLVWSRAYRDDGFVVIGVHMEGDSGGATAVFYGCRSEVGANRAPADDWSSSEAAVRSAG